MATKKVVKGKVIKGKKVVNKKVRPIKETLAKLLKTSSKVVEAPKVEDVPPIAPIAPIVLDAPIKGDVSPSITSSAMMPTNENGTVTKLWCQFPCDGNKKLKLQALKNMGGFKTLGDLALSLFDEALKKANLA